MNKGQHNTFKKLSLDFFSTEKFVNVLTNNTVIQYNEHVKSICIVIFETSPPARWPTLSLTEGLRELIASF